MDPKFQTSFIPKKQPIPSIGGMGISRPPQKVTSIFMVIAVFVFIVSIGALGGAYTWKMYLSSNQISLKKQLVESEGRFNIDQIKKLKAANVQMDTAKMLIGEHVALSQVFGILQRITVSSVQFNSMELATGEEKDSLAYEITMAGQGVNLPTVAVQADTMTQLEAYGLSKVLKNPIISDPELETNGTVSFGFSASLDPAELRYGNLVTGAGSDGL